MSVDDLFTTMMKFECLDNKIRSDVMIVSTQITGAAPPVQGPTPTTTTVSGGISTSILALEDV